MGKTRRYKIYYCQKTNIPPKNFYKIFAKQYLEQLSPGSMIKGVNIKYLVQLNEKNQTNLICTKQRNCTRVFFVVQDKFANGNLQNKP